ncbi:Rhodanese-related sulfurtransferase [Mesobacillus persicus]|uniref:Rhodanese-related sulfurtransferase n=2 Tax=Mesobacillus persicus TaxID=930146 RepID=A0A1H8AJH9_9BACI|nr:Rhodanese-related sulfurtransferase [Mesobacillus persicus]
MKRFMVLLMATFIIGGCSAQEVTSEKSEYKSVTSDDNKERNFKDVTSEEAIDMLTDPEINILDVRSPEGFSEGHIPNAESIPLKELEASYSTLDKTKTYLIVCKAGKTSETASTLLAENGFENIYNLTGGMDRWTGEVIN